jgi:hypothetical protein
MFADPIIVLLELTPMSPKELVLLAPLLVLNVLAHFSLNVRLVPTDSSFLNQNPLV